MRIRRRGDGDRVGSRPGRACGAEAEVLAVVAGGDHRDDACERGVVDRLVHRVVRRVGLRPAAGEVDHVHAVGDRRLEGVDDLRRVGLVTERRRDGEHAVVADPGLRRDAREVRHLWMVVAGRRGRVLVTCGDPRDMRPVRLRRVERLVARSVPDRAGEHLRDDHLRRRDLDVALREARRVREAVRVEKRARRIDAGVDDGDLDALAFLSGRGFEIGGVDDARAPVHRLGVREARVDLGDRPDAEQLGQRACGKLHGEAVDQDREMLLDLRLRDRRPHLGHRRPLQAGKLRQVRDGGCRVHVEMVRARGERERAIGAPSCQRRGGQLHDHARQPSCVGRRDADHARANARQRRFPDRAANRCQGGRGRRRRHEPEHRRKQQQATQGPAD